MARILIADDGYANRVIMATILEAAGFVTVEAADGTIALDCVRAQRPDLIILDLNLPGLSGADLVRSLRAVPGIADVPIALYTASTPDEMMHQFMTLYGIKYAIPKPSEPDDILKIVKAALEEST